MATETIRTGSRDGPAGRRRARAVVGIVLLVAGVVLLAATSGYYLYGKFARSNLDDLGFEAARPRFAGEGYGLTAPPATGSLIRTPAPSGAIVAPNEPPSASHVGDTQSTGAPQGAAPAAVDASSGSGAGGGTAAAAAAVDAPADSSAAAPSGPSQTRAGVGAENVGETEAPAETSQAGGSAGVVATAAPRAAAASRTPSTSAAASITPSVPGAASDEPPQHTAYDTRPSSGGVARPAEPAAPDPRLAAIAASIAEIATYSAPTPEDLASSGALATRIRIPAIEVDAVIDELRIRQLGDSLAWETPKRVVGHIPRTAKAGAAGQGWYFGHLESPIRGEGNVFARLPEIPKLAADSPIYIFLETAGRHYAYQVYVTDVVYEDDIALTDTGAHDITLVTCTPRFYYDHRLLVTAALVGIREA